MNSAKGSSTKRYRHAAEIIVPMSRRRANAALSSRLSGSITWFRERSEFVKVLVVAVIGTGLSWATYEIVYWINPLEPRATISWTISFTIGIFRQHHLHRTLTFPRNALSYWASLRRDIASSIVLALISTAFNYVLTENLGIFHRGAWIACAGLVAGLEYLFIKFFVFPQRVGHMCAGGQPPGEER